MPVQLSEKQVASFWSKVDKTVSPPTYCSDLGNCWIWRGHVQSRGYGNPGFNGSKCLAHRLSWELENGEIQTGLRVLHRCDVPRCINPQHLFLGTDLDNARDRVAKGRTATKLSHPEAFAKARVAIMASAFRGEFNRNAKLCDADVVAIRLQHADGKRTQTDLAIEFGVSRRTIFKVINRIGWAHI